MSWFNFFAGLVQLILAVLDRLDKKEREDEIRKAYEAGVRDTNIRHDLDELLQRYRARRRDWRRTSGAPEDPGADGHAS